MCPRTLVCLDLSECITWHNRLLTKYQQLILLIIWEDVIDTEIAVSDYPIEWCPETEIILLKKSTKL